MTHILSFIRTYWVVISLLILSVITLLSLWPADQLPKVPGTDKTHHFIAYAALMFPVALRQHKYWLVIGLVFIGWSGAIELIQPYVNRYGEWLDMLANSGGILCGALLAYLVRLLLKPLGKLAE
ncbi:VanZ family protein [Neptunomonas qingdaonensis]